MSDMHLCRYGGVAVGGPRDGYQITSDDLALTVLQSSLVAGRAIRGIYIWRPPRRRWFRRVPGYWQWIPQWCEL